MSTCRACSTPQVETDLHGLCPECQNPDVKSTRFRYLDQIPTIPFHLHESISIEWLSRQPNTFKTPGYENRQEIARLVTDYYRQYDVTQPALLEWLSSNLPCKFWAKWQLIVDGMVPHKDFGRTECLNYIIHTGGPTAEIRFYDDTKQVELERHRIESLRWHWLDVSTNHCPANFPGVRWSLTVCPIDYSFRETP